jgi:uncharacterized membrane protein YoaK (UPF0700 family)
MQGMLLDNSQLSSDRQQSSKLQQCKENVGPATSEHGKRFPSSESGRNQGQTSIPTDEVTLDQSIKSTGQKEDQDDPENPSASGQPPYLRQEVKTTLYVEIQLILLALGTGMIDGITFPQYNVFSSNQTGNTIMLAVGALSLAPDAVSLPNSAFSLGSFLVGAFICGQAANYIGRHKRWWVLLANVAGISLIFVAAALRHFLEYDSRGKHAWSVIILCAFSSGAQAAYARTMDCPEITTVVITSAYADLMVDKNLFTLDNVKRNRRAALILSMLTGGFLGSIMTKFASASVAFLVAAIVKMVSVCLLLL